MAGRSVGNEIWVVGIVCVYNYGERKNHKKAKGLIPVIARKEETSAGQDKKGQG